MNNFWSYVLAVGVANLIQMVVVWALFSVRKIRTAYWRWYYKLHKKFTDEAIDIIFDEEASE